METKEQQAKEYAEKIPHYQDRKQHAAEDFLQGWEAAERWIPVSEGRPNKEDYVILLISGNPVIGSGFMLDEVSVITHWMPIPKMPEE